MSHRRTRKRTLSARRPRFAVLMLPALLLVTSACMSTQRQARQEAAERWNQVRAEVKAKLASDQLAAGHVDDAATQLAAALRLDPANPELLTLQARVHLARGDHRAAQRLLEGIEAEGKLQAEINYLLGIIQQQRLHWDEALNHFARAASGDPGEVAYVVAVVQNMLQLGEAQEALALLHSHEDEFGWTEAYHAAVAECCEQLEDWSAAAAAWEKVAGANAPPAVRERLAMALYRCERWPEAIAHLQRLLDEPEVHPIAPLRLALAQCLLETHQPAAAQEQVSRVLREHPQNATALRLLAHVFARQEQFERARRTAERALRLEPDSPHALELVAALAYQAGDKARACLLAERIQQSFPDLDSPVARQILAEVSAAPSETQ
ncbi:MAG: tetratricopeptide repeat protein [Phycisphaerae bacterium]